MSFSVLGISELVMFSQTPKSLDLFSLLMGADFLLYPFLLSLSSAWSKLFLDSLWALGLCRTPQAPLPMSCIPGGAPGGGIPRLVPPIYLCLVGWVPFQGALREAGGWELNTVCRRRPGKEWVIQKPKEINFFLPPPTESQKELERTFLKVGELKWTVEYVVFFLEIPPFLYLSIWFLFLFHKGLSLLKMSNLSYIFAEENSSSQWCHTQ